MGGGEGEEGKRGMRQRCRLGAYSVHTWGAVVVLSGALTELAFKDVYPPATAAPAPPIHEKGPANSEAFRGLVKAIP